MHIALKTIAILMIALALGSSSNVFASETGDSLNALQQEVTELKQVIAELAKYIKSMETRLQTLERAVQQRDNPNEPQLPIDIEIGTWIDDLQMQQKFSR